MLEAVEDEELLLWVLNSAPAVSGRRTEHLTGSAGGAQARRHGGSGRPEELARLREVRDVLQDVVRDNTLSVDDLVPVVEKATMRPRLGHDGVRWSLDAPADLQLAVRTVLAWSRTRELLAGRLRPCANTECNLFLIDHSRPGTARWCSMAACGNRAKARTHARRRRTSAQESSGPAEEVGE